MKNTGVPVFFYFIYLLPVYLFGREYSQYSRCKSLPKAPVSLSGEYVLRFQILKSMIVQSLSASAGISV